MTRVLVLSLLTVLFAEHVGFAQTPQTAPAPVTPAAAAPATPATAPAGHAAPEKESDALEPQGFTYDPEGRRDPFVSLLRRGATSTSETGKRLAGLTGLGTAEVSLRGVIKSNGSFVGILQGVDNKTYIVRAGDKLSDGSIRSITADAMVILQQVNDPFSLQKEHEVRKLLRQTEEGK